MNLRSKLAAGAASLAPFAAMAQTAGDIDTSGIVSTITTATTNVAAIGGAVLSVLVVAMVFKWVRKAF